MCHGSAASRRAVRLLALPLLAALLLLAAAAPASAEVQHKVQLTMLAGVYRLANLDWGLAGTGKGRLFAEGGTEAVRGGLVIDTLLGTSPGGGQAIFDVSRLYLKARFPLGEEQFFRLHLGKTRLAWGEGRVFNAADLLFGASPNTAALDMSAEVLRDESAWLASLYFPLGDFSFFEPVALYPLPDFTNPTAPVLLNRIKSGARLQFKLAETKIEAAYLFEAQGWLHRPALSVQGQLWANIFAAVSTQVRGGEWQPDDWHRNLMVSAGAFHNERFLTGESIGFRVEALYRPAGSWEAGTATHALVTYGELTFAPDNRTTLMLRLVASPVDASGLGTLGLYWKPYQGFTLLVLASAATGDSGDLFSWTMSGSPGFLFGCMLSY